MGDVIPFPRCPVPNGLGTALAELDEAMEVLRRMCVKRDEQLAASIEPEEPDESIEQHLHYEDEV